MFFLKRFVFVLVGLIVVVQSSESNASNLLESNELYYEYVKESVRSSSGGVLYYHGKILVKNKNGKVVYSENTNLQPGMCDEYPAGSKFIYKFNQQFMPRQEKEIVVFCGSISGRHKTLKLFSGSSGGLRTTAIDFENTKPNLTKVDGNNTYTSIVYRRLLFKEVGYQPIPYLFVYALHDDSSMFGFKPAYGSSVKQHYMSYYKSLKKNINDENYKSYIGPLLASLISVEDEDEVCNEFVWFVDKLSASLDANVWVKRLVAAGYPDFNFEICHRGE
ncbi:MAG: hypothetical protein OEY01_14020 [Desulfobulbaceae bacterium]|nr:hypothetical protein [Desulfobulbaceae bacterium]